MDPILERIPPDGDATAEAVLELARGGVTADLLGCLNGGDPIALNRYGARHDVMVGLAVFYFVAHQVGQVPAEVFDEVASCIPDGWVPDLLREFGARTDITLKAFGWLLVETPDGPDFTPAPPPWARGTS